MDLRAKFIVVDANRVIENGVIKIKGNLIEEIGKAGKYSQVYGDLGDAVLMPGLVNAHTHLRLTDVLGKIPPGTPFDKWIVRLAKVFPDWSKEKKIESTKKGLSILVRNGVTSVGEVTSLKGPYLLPCLRRDRLRKVVFLEVIDTEPLNARRDIDEVENLIKSQKGLHNFSFGIYPHAPYTVSPVLYTLLARLARGLGLPFATHIGETQDEVRLLQGKKSTFTDLNKRFGIPAPFETPPKLYPIEYLLEIGALYKGVNLVHCNYLTDGEIELIARHGGIVVFCPGSHKYFGHKRHPIHRLLKRGITIAVGTDSLASNSELNIFSEMKILRKEYRLEPSTIFKMVTENGARALFGAKRLGVLRKGYLADVIAVALPPNVKKKDVLGFLCESANRVLASIIDGRIIYKCQ
jgi:cytosine/adenosine deaminase-related metal-dependent hydrolase